MFIREGVMRRSRGLVIAVACVLALAGCETPPRATYRVADVHEPAARAFERFGVSEAPVGGAQRAWLRDQMEAAARRRAAELGFEDASVTAEAASELSAGRHPAPAADLDQRLAEVLEARGMKRDGDRPRVRVAAAEALGSFRYRTSARRRADRLVAPPVDVGETAVHTTPGAKPFAAMRRVTAPVRAVGVFVFGAAGRGEPVGRAVAVGFGEAASAEHVSSVLLEAAVEALVKAEPGSAQAGERADQPDNAEDAAGE